MVPPKKKNTDTYGPELARESFLILSYDKKTYNQIISELTKRLAIEKPDVTPRERLKLAQQMYRDSKNHIKT
jgi:hypothetical protein